MRTTKGHILRTAAAMAVLLASTPDMTAQTAVSLLLDDGEVRMRSNPALLPSRGYLTVPAIGATDISATSSLGAGNLLYRDDDGTLHTPLSRGYPSDVLQEAVGKTNTAAASARITLGGAGWWRGRTFWSISASMHAQTVTTLTDEAVMAIKNMSPHPAGGWGDLSYCSSEYLSMADLCAGIGRDISEKFQYGIRLHLLLGLQGYEVRTADSYAAGGGDATAACLKTYGQMHGKGMTTVTDTAGHLRGIEWQIPGGIDGGGIGVDIGMAIRPSEETEISFSLCDLGFIVWHTNTPLNLKGSFMTADGGDDAARRLKDRYTAFRDLATVADGSADRTSSTPARMTVGFNYAFIPGRLKAGLSLSGRLAGGSRSYTTLTIGAGGRPLKWLECALAFQATPERVAPGLALRILDTITIAWDAIPLSWSGDGLPMKAFCSTLTVGVSIPLGASHTVGEGE